MVTAALANTFVKCGIILALARRARCAGRWRSSPRCVAVAGVLPLLLR